MPNWCFIDCTFDEDRYADIAALMQTDRNMFDFNQLIKEPPELEITCGSKETKGLKWYLDNHPELPEKAKKAFECKAGWVGESPVTDEEKITGTQAAENYLKYGFCDWYDWRCAKWNTKWNAAEVQWDPSNSVHYWTAWDAPWPIFAELSKRFPDVLFHYDIEWEEGFAAEAEYLGGEQTFYEDRELTWNEEEEE